MVEDQPVGPGQHRHRLVAADLRVGRLVEGVREGQVAGGEVGAVDGDRRAARGAPGAAVRPRRAVGPVVGDHHGGRVRPRPRKTRCGLSAGTMTWPWYVPGLIRIDERAAVAGRHGVDGGLHRGHVAAAVAGNGHGRTGPRSPGPRSPSPCGGRPGDCAGDGSRPCRQQCPSPHACSRLIALAQLPATRPVDQTRRLGSPGRHGSDHPGARQESAFQAKPRYATERRSSMGAESARRTVRSAAANGRDQRPADVVAPHGPHGAPADRCAPRLIRARHGAIAPARLIARHAGHPHPPGCAVGVPSSRSPFPAEKCSGTSLFARKRRSSSSRCSTQSGNDVGDRIPSPARLPGPSDTHPAGHGRAPRRHAPRTADHAPRHGAPTPPRPRITPDHGHGPCARAQRCARTRRPRSVDHGIQRREVRESGHVEIQPPRYAHDRREQVGARQERRNRRGEERACQVAVGPLLVRERTTSTTCATASSSGTPLRCEPSR